MPLVLAMYLLLCLPVRLQTDVFAGEDGAGAHVFISMMGIGMRADFRVQIGEGGVRLMRLYEDGDGGRTERAANGAALRRLGFAMISAARRRIIDVSISIGSGDAAVTALAAGALQAAGAALGAAGKRCETVFCVNPVFTGHSAYIAAGGIFEAAPGDIIRRLIVCPHKDREKRPIRTARKEGVLWTGIRSRA